MKRILLFALLATLSFSASTTKTGGSGKSKVGGSGTTKVNAVAAPQPDILWVKFNENTGTLAGDSSTVGTNTLDLSSSGMWAAGQAGTAIAGNGSSTHADSTGTVPYGVNVITVSFWLKTASYAGTLMLLESGANLNTTGGSWFIYCDSGVINFGMTDNSSGIRQENIATPSTGVFHHYLFKFDGSTTAGAGTAWVDGVSVTATNGTNTKANIVNFSTQTLHVFYRANLSFFFAATLDDLRIWTGDKSGSVAAIYASAQ